MNIVAHCGLTRSAGGLFYAVTSLSKAMTSQGVSLSVLGKGDEYFEDDFPEWAPVEVVACKAVGPLGSSGELRRHISKLQPELIHQHGLWMDDQWAAWQWQKKTGRPVVVSPHGMLDPWAVANAAWKKKLVSKLFAQGALDQASCIHALCRSEADSIRAYGLTNPIAIIPNGIELPEIGPPNFNLHTSSKKKLLFLGRIHPKKGLAELISGWAKARHESPKSFSQWQLLIAGWDDGNHLEGLKKLASESGLPWSDSDSSASLSSVHSPQSSEVCFPAVDLCFIGPQFGEEKEHLLRSVDAFILPSFSEGLPMSVLEAWSYGLPVVMTEFCNIPEGFKFDAALQIEPTSDSVAQGLVELVAMKESDLAQCGLNGRQLVEERFTWDRIAQEMKSVYEWCLGGEQPECVEL